MRRTFLSFLATAVLLAMAPEVRCEDSTPNSNGVIFASGGLGAGGPGIAGLLSLNFGRGDRILELRYVTTEELAIFGPWPAESNEDFGLLVGKLSRTRYGLGYVAAGLSVTHSVRRGKLISPGAWFFGPEYERIEHVTLGVPFEVRGTVNAPWVGIGLSVYGDINTKSSFVGLAVVVQVGKLR